MSVKHIKIKNAKDCSGCGACKEICPKRCISMHADGFGLLYPSVDKAKCVECGLCVKVCPFLNTLDEHKPLQCFAAVNKDSDELFNSSSGGLFVRFATFVLEQHGVVFGAVFNEDWTVHHVVADSLKGIKAMMGSKYVQSSTENTFSDARKILNEGRCVLYTGTPCQIAGLNRFLRKDYTNLLTIEVICHGVPAPAIWTSYLDQFIARLQERQGVNNTDFTSYNKLDSLVVKRVNFRNKDNGWKRYGFDLYLDSGSGFEINTDSISDKQNRTKHSVCFRNNEYMRAFLSNWSLRDSCYACKCKSGRSKADLTIGDFWGFKEIGELHDDDRGISCVILRSQKAKRIYNELTNVTSVPTTYDSILRGNPSIEISVDNTIDARRFKRLFLKSGFYRSYNATRVPSISFKLTKLSARILQKFRRKLFPKII